jgi:hypothetical protein
LRMATTRHPAICSRSTLESERIYLSCPPINPIFRRPA